MATACKHISRQIFAHSVSFSQKGYKNREVKIEGFLLYFLSYKDIRTISRSIIIIIILS